MEFGKRQDTTDTQRTFARANLLRTCYGETSVMGFGLYTAMKLLQMVTMYRVSK